MKIFALFDEDGTGAITFRNLKRVATELGENLTDDELQARGQALTPAGRWGLSLAAYLWISVAWMRRPLVARASKELTRTVPSIGSASHLELGARFRARCSACSLLSARSVLFSSRRARRLGCFPRRGVLFAGNGAGRRKHRLPPGSSTPTYRAACGTPPLPPPFPPPLSPASLCPRPSEFCWTGHNLFRVAWMSGSLTYRWVGCWAVLSP